MAEIFRDNGYATLMVGKWHLCKDSDLSDAGDKHSWPLQRASTGSTAFLDAFTNLHQPAPAVPRTTTTSTVDQYPDDYYLTDDLTDRAIQMIRELEGRPTRQARSSSTSPTAPSTLRCTQDGRHRAPPGSLRRRVGRVCGRSGWPARRELGVVPAGTQLPPRNTEPASDVAAVGRAQRRRAARVFARYMEVYAAMVETIDQSVGRLRAALDAARRARQHDLHLHVSDNGASREGRSCGTHAVLP